MSRTATPTRLILMLVACLGLLVPDSARSQGKAQDLLSAIVALDVTVPRDARTAVTLGTKRQGNGIVIDADGLIVTIGYLILEAQDVTVRNAAGKTFPAAIVAYHAESGLGLLRAKGALEATPVKLGSAVGLVEKDKVLIAAAGGMEGLRPAIVASRRAFAGPWEYAIEDAIYTAPPHPSFGGAGLIGNDGRLLGIGYLAVGAALEDESVFPGNMFVPIDVLKPVMGDLLAQGQAPGPRRPWLGLYTQEYRGRLFVDRLADEGPSEAAGLRPGDIVLGVAGRPVSGMHDFYRKVWGLGEAGTAVPLTVLQGAEIREVTVQSIDRYKWFKSERSF